MKNSDSGNSVKQAYSLMAFIVLLLLLIILFLNYCGGGNSEQQEQVEYKEEMVFNDKLNKDTRFNLNVLIDLSERIDTSKEGRKEVKYRDLELIKELAAIWKAHVVRKPLRVWNDVFNIRVHPPPTNKELRGYFNKLQFDMTKIKKRYKEEELKSYLSGFEELVKRRTGKIYNTVLERHEENKDSQFIGSDIHGFFENEIEDLGVIQMNSYNLLVVVTDGYIYWKDDKGEDYKKEDDAIPEIRFDTTFQDFSIKELSEKGYKLIPAHDNLKDLDVIFAELNPHNKPEKDYKRIQFFIKKWLSEMNVNNYKLYKTDIPENTEDKLKTYFSKSQ